MKVKLVKSNMGSIVLIDNFNPFQFFLIIHIENNTEVLISKHNNKCVLSKLQVQTSFLNKSL
jgi:hypothetical protein